MYTQGGRGNGRGKQDIGVGVGATGWMRGGIYRQSVLKRILLAGVPGGTIQRAGYGQYFNHYFRLNLIYFRSRGTTAREANLPVEVNDRRYICTALSREEEGEVTTE